MTSVYLRRKKYWARVKDGKWESITTPFGAGEKEKAERYAAAYQRKIDERRAKGEDQPHTVKTYAEHWIAQRKKSGLASASVDEARITKHALPCIGKLMLAEVRVQHIRDLVRDLRANSGKAPRTIRHVYSILNSMFEDALIDELIAANPCKLRRKRELPKKQDKDPEWRSMATYTVGEVERLLSEPGLPVERRVMYALKALGGLRHGEFAALRWRHYEPASEPLGRISIVVAYNSLDRVEKDVKGGIARRLPVHPVLAKILAEWKLSHWERIFGRQPGGDDLVVPARTMNPMSSNDAVRAMKADLERLDLRVKAGKGGRSRGGHDLRSWFITTCQEHGAHRDLLRLVTHGAGGDAVFEGYTRASWAALCAEVSKLRISPKPNGEVLELATHLATREESLGNRWRKLATPMGFEAKKTSNYKSLGSLNDEHHRTLADAKALSRTEGVASLATRLAAAIRDGDQALALELLEAMGAAPAVVVSNANELRKVK